MSGTKFPGIITNNIQTLQEELFHLLHASKFRVLDVKKELKQHDVKGVYMIICNGKSVYVGKTRTGTIGTRMRDHVNITEPSDLNQMIKRHTDFPQEVSEYEVQYIEISNDRRRGLVEDFVISVLNPPFNRVEN